MSRSVRVGVWRLADPKISLASIAAMGLGTAAAAAHGPLHAGWLALTVLGVLAVETAKNASGEIFDYDSGTDLAITTEDRSPFSGGKRVLVDRLLTRRQTWAVAAAAYGLAALASALVVSFREPRALAFCLAGFALAFFYHAPPLRFSYRGMGEAAVAIAYGPLLVGGTYLVQRGSAPAAVLLLGVPLGLLIAAFLWINEFPDYRADAGAGKRNLVVRLGRPTAARGFAILVAAAFGALGCLPLAGLPITVWLGAVAAVPAFAAARTLARHSEETASIVPAQGRTLLAFLLLALASGLGVWLGS